MGCAASKEPFIKSVECGTESEFKERFEEQNTLGEGEFGVVKLISDKNNPASDPFAVKILNKGFVFKDNTLYTPMKPGVLAMEIDILRELDGKKYNLVLDSVYESSSKVYVVTEICSGGELLEYTAKNMADGLRTEDVSRIAYQLLSAVDHCARHNVVHRDIKPENIMFKANTKTSELRLIDFGCATMDETVDVEHITFAGTPFYISPEMFQKKYTTKTDVFSVGVALYVLVGGYPAADLQTAFNLLQKSKRDLKTLPGMPDNMPETYYEMLDKMLTYRYKGRKSAGEMLDDEFVLFHQHLEGGVPLKKRMSMKRTQSMLLTGSGEKAAIAFEFSKFERSVTTILVSMLAKEDVSALVSKVEAFVSCDKLGVIHINELKKLLEDMKKSEIVSAIEKQKNAKLYNTYAYDYTLLKPFEKKSNPTAKDVSAEGLDPEKSLATYKISQFSSRTLSSSGRSSKGLSSSVGSSKRIAMSKTKSVFIRGI